MTLRIDFAAEDTLLKVVASGTAASASEVREYNRQLFAATEAHGCSLVLVDEREYQEHLDTGDIFEMATQSALAARRVRAIAIVSAPAALDGLEFFATVAGNRGLLVRRFAEPEPARRWLDELRDVIRNAAPHPREAAC